jgi:hypothetical protein
MITGQAWQIKTEDAGAALLEKIDNSPQFTYYLRVRSNKNEIESIQII